MRIFILIIISFFLQSCMNDKHQTYNNEKAEINQFWYSFADQNLNALIKEALLANTDVLTSMINISKAQATLDIAQANRLPEIDITASTYRNRDSENLSSTFMHEPYNTFNLSAVMSYQVDIWGKMAAASKSAKAQLAALESTKKAVEITIASEVAKAYFNIVALDNKIQITNNLLVLNEDLVKLKIKQLKIGISDAVEVEQMKSQAYMAKSNLIFLKQMLVKEENALAVLLGRDVSKSIIARGKNIESFAILKMPNNIQSKVLLKRPDVIAAEHMLEAAKYQVNVARASYFPEISLNSLLGLGSNYTGSLFDSKSRAKNIGANLSLPIFNFGKTSAKVAYAKADNSQSLLDYQQTIRMSFAEAITEMSAQKNACENFIQVKHSENALQKNYIIANMQFHKGLIDKLIKIEAEKKYLSGKVNVVDAAQLRLSSTIDLFKALGGSLE